MIALLLQLSLAGSVGVTAGSSDAFYRDREMLGVRYRTMITAPLGIQAGFMMANENGLFPSKSGAGVRHWAIGLEYRPIPQVSAGLIYGRFIEQRSVERPHPGLVDVGYYQLVAIGWDIRLAGMHLTSETLVLHPKSVHVGLHSFIGRFQSKPIDGMLQLIEHSPDQPRYAFWTIEGTARPLFFLKAPWRWVGIHGGTRTVQSYQEDRAMRIRFLDAGLYIGGVIP